MAPHAARRADDFMVRRSCAVEMVSLDSKIGMSSFYVMGDCGVMKQNVLNISCLGADCLSSSNPVTMVMGRRGHLNRQTTLPAHKGIVQETAQSSPSLGSKPQRHGAHKASEQTYLKMRLYPLRREAEFMYSEPAGEAAPLSLGIRQGCDGILCSNASQGRTTGRPACLDPDDVESLAAQDVGGKHL